MKVMIVYATSLGATQGIAQRIGQVLAEQGFEVRVRSVEGHGEMEPLTSVDAFVVGSAVHGGHWLPEATAFVHQHAARLAERPVWLFSSGPVGDKYVGRQQPEPDEVSELESLIRPRDHRVFAGAFDRDSPGLGRLSFIQRTAIKAFLPEGDFRDWPAIEKWALGIARDLRHLPVASLAS